VLLRDEDFGPQLLFSLERFAKEYDWAQTMVDARHLDTVAELLKSPVFSVRDWARNVLGCIPGMYFLLGPLLATQPGSQLVSFLRQVPFLLLGFFADDPPAMAMRMSSRGQHGS
jgi:hypothetical protein